MNIRDIAAAAQVSVSTVSKVLNGKDADISEATRQRILAVVREYQYVPYAGVRSRQPAVRALALFLGDLAYYNPPFLTAVEQAAAAAGYSLLLCNVCDADTETLDKQLKITLSKPVGGILLCTDREDVIDRVRVAVQPPTALAVLTAAPAPGCAVIRCDYAAASRDAVELLITRGHQRIAFVLDEACPAVQNQLRRGIRAALQSRALEFRDRDAALCRAGSPALSRTLSELMNRNPTALYCQSPALAMAVHEYLTKNAALFPQRIPLICGVKTDSPLAPGITAYAVPYRALAEKAVACLTAPDREEPREEVLPLLLTDAEFLSAPLGTEAPILVLGTCIADTILSVDRLPRTGELLDATSVATDVGGKCVSQSVAITRLGGCAYAIGKVGNDPQGREIINTLAESGVHTEGIAIDGTAATGRSFLTMAANGDYSIVTYSGANRFLDVQPVKALSYLLPSVFACLISTEIPFDVIKYLVQKCLPYGIRIFLKPSVPIPVDAAFLSHIDYFMPEKVELDQMLPGPEGVREKAIHFYDLGCKNVIVPMADKGCYVKNKAYDLFVPSSNFRAVQTASSSNCFIAALCMSLAQEDNLLYGLSYATFAAGLSISQPGMYPSFPYKQHLHLYLDEIHDFYHGLLARLDGAL